MQPLKPYWVWGTRHDFTLTAGNSLEGGLQAAPTPCLKQTLVLVFAALFLLVAPSTETAQAQTAQSLDIRAVALSQFFQKFKCPSLNYQLIPNYLEAADKYNIDYRLLPAISIQESSCGQHYPSDTNNLWGWASARVRFESLQVGVDFVSQQLANGRYYAGKNLDDKLKAYNPNATYALKIKALMKEISNEPQNSDNPPLNDEGYWSSAHCSVCDRANCVLWT